MKFNPKSPQELKHERGIIAAGVADFEIIEAEEKTSKKGNPMIELTLRIWDSEGNKGQVFDYIVLNFHWKLISLLDAIGCPGIYETGEVLVEQLVGKTGKCTIKIEKSEQYGDQPKVKDYQISHLTELNKKDDLPDFNDKDGDVPF